MPFQRRGTLLIPSGPDYDRQRMHLHVVCTDPCPDEKQVIVSVCTKFANCDATCILQPHEHDWLQHESFVFYAYAQTVPCVALERGIEQDIFKPKLDINGQSFLRVYNGLCASIHTPRKVKTYLGCAVAVVDP